MTTITPTKPVTALAERFADELPGWVEQFGPRFAAEEAASLIEKETQAGRLASDLAVLVKEFCWQRDRLKRMLQAGNAKQALAALERMGSDGNHALIAARETLRQVGV